MARFRHGRERRTCGIGSLLAEKAEKRSEKESEGQPTFHKMVMVKRGWTRVNDYPP